MKLCLGLHTIIAFAMRGRSTRYSGNKYACSKGSCVSMQSWSYIQTNKYTRTLRIGIHIAKLDE